jgi:hypothetical protein
VGQYLKFIAEIQIRINCMGTFQEWMKNVPRNQQEIHKKETEIKMGTAS